MLTIDNLIANLPAFVLTGVRIGGVFVLAPLFGSSSIPPVYRVWLTLLLAFLLLPAVSQSPLQVTGIAYVPLIARELAVGLLMGFIVSMFLVSASYAGRLAGAHIGFGLANLIDPMTNEQATILDQLQGLMALVLFLSLGGHRMLLHALGASFSIVPLGQAVMPTNVIDGILRLFAQVVILGVQIAIPVLASVFLAETAVGIISRGVPQFNIFSIGLLLRVVVGIVVFSISLPLMTSLMKRAIGSIPAELHGLLVQLAP